MPAEGTRIPHSTLRKMGDVEQVTCMVRRDSLKPAPWNPPGRTQLRVLTALRLSMEKNGFWTFQPLMVANDSTIVDGHRRWTVAGLLGIDLVPVTLVDVDPGELWAMLNGTHMNMSGAQALQAVSMGLNTLPPAFADNIMKLDSIVGVQNRILLSQKPGGCSPHIINQALRIARYIGRKDDNAFVTKIVFWLTDHRQMNVASTAAMKSMLDPSIIENAVLKNIPLRHTFGI